ncbi:hypothetical protein SISNIDRAFT_486355 [Sistotremastrum niveocremeum HHB9708]|uniref:Uncharacterized protein n=1 Tax=Sistotremastrum niveocremeum HHB9708 TaxID=1314777 RepID=A0A164U2G7_9AGAM|nr:hypothetical protein SISNIDRAFT_486355 [Sistotremastrum niveocremeum HHB9708]
MAEWLSSTCKFCGDLGFDHVNAWMLEDEPAPSSASALPASHLASSATLGTPAPPPPYAAQAPGAVAVAPGLFADAADRRQAAVEQVLTARNVENQYAHLAAFMNNVEPTTKRGSGSKQQGPKKKAKVEGGDVTTVCLVLLPDTDHVNAAQGRVMVHAGSRNTKLLAIYRERSKMDDPTDAPFGRTKPGYTAPSVNLLAKLAELGLCVMLKVRKTDQPEDIHRKIKHAFKHVALFPKEEVVGYRILQAEDTSQGRPRVLTYYEPADPNVALVEPITGNALSLVGRRVHEAPGEMKYELIAFLAMKATYPNIPWHYRGNFVFLTPEDVVLYTRQRKGKARRRDVTPENAEWEHDVIGTLVQRGEYIGAWNPAQSSGPPSTRASTRASGSTAVTTVTTSTTPSEFLSDEAIFKKWGVDAPVPLDNKWRENAALRDIEHRDWISRDDEENARNKAVFAAEACCTIALVSNIRYCEGSKIFHERSVIYASLEALYYAAQYAARQIAFGDGNFNALRKGLRTFDEFLEAIPIQDIAPIPGSEEEFEAFSNAIYFGDAARPGLREHVEVMQKGIEVFGRPWQKAEEVSYERAIAMRSQLATRLGAIRSVVSMFKLSSLMTHDGKPARVYLDPEPCSTKVAHGLRVTRVPVAGTRQDQVPAILGTCHSQTRRIRVWILETTGYPPYPR